MKEVEFLGLCKGEFGGTRYSMTKDMNLAELEKRIRESAERIARKLLESRLEEDPRTHPADPVCRKCGGRFRIQESAQRRVLKTTVGEIEYERAYGVCDRCGHTGAPLDEALGIPSFGPSVEARQKICHATVVGRSFEDGQEILSVHSGVELSAKHVRTIAEKEGRDLVEERGKEVASYREGPMQVIGSETPELIVVTVDGGRVQTRNPQPDERWKEDKIGVVYDAMAMPNPEAQPGEYEGAKSRTKTYCATLENWESMGWMLRLEAERRGYANAKAKVFIADGAKAIRELKNMQFPEAVFILDWAHATQHLSSCAKAFWGEGNTKAVREYEKLRTLLWEGQIDRIIYRLQKFSERLGPPKETDSEFSIKRILHQNAFSYFPNNRTAMDYPRFRSQGWPIGSGVAEGAIKQFALRLKSSEKFWNMSHTGAEEILALCALYHSEDDRWDRHWRKRAQPR